MQTRRKFSKEFKEETVKLANQSGVTLKQLGAELGLSPNMISRWRRELSQSGTVAFKGKGHARDEEMARLKRELARVKKERDFLKDAAVFFAKESK
jgi:transposase